MNTQGMGTADDGLDDTSRRLLDQIDELKRLELDKRRAARDSDEFSDLAAKVERAARDVFDTTALQRSKGEEDSPIEAEEGPGPSG